MSPVTGATYASFDSDQQIAIDAGGMFDFSSIDDIALGIGRADIMHFSAPVMDNSGTVFETFYRAEMLAGSLGLSLVAQGGDPTPAGGTFNHFSRGESLDWDNKRGLGYFGLDTAGAERGLFRVRF